MNSNTENGWSNVIKRSRAKDFSRLVHIVEDLRAPQPECLSEAFVWSGLSNDLSLVQAYLKHGVSIRERYSGNTILHVAVRIPFPDFLQDLIELGADINALDSENATPLISVSRLGKDMAQHRDHFLANIAVLLQHNSDPNMKDVFGRTALDYLARSRWDQAALRVLESDATVRDCDDGGWWVMWSAVEGGDTQLLKRLIQEDGAVDLVSRPNDEISVMEFAAKNGCLDHVQILVDAGGNDHLRDGRSAIAVASEQRNAMASLDATLAAFGIKRRT